MVSLWNFLLFHVSKADCSVERVLDPEMYLLFDAAQVFCNCATAAKFSPLVKN